MFVVARRHVHEQFDHGDRNDDNYRHADHDDKNDDNDKHVDHGDENNDNDSTTQNAVCATVRFVGAHKHNYA